jgi:diguanylate cyclase (GGDEF)-like protein
MELNEKQFILKLKSRFLELFDTDDDLLHFETLLKKMLLIIKRLTGASDVSFYSCNNMKQQLLMEATTAKQEKKIEEGQPLPIPCMGLQAFVSGRKIIRNPFPFSQLNHYDLLLSLRKDEKTLGYIALDGCKQFLTVYSDSIIENIASICALFLYRANGLCQTIIEEKRYKQLFRVTEKFHSSMDIDAVLGEIIFTLQEVYPSFTYYLMLSHDNNGHENLPIKDLEYDSENLSAMEAFVTGRIQMEDSLQGQRSILYAPLKGKQGVYGVLQVISPNTVVFPKNEVEFITLLANTAGSALENAQLYQQSKKLISDLQLINETSHRLNSNLRLTETINFMTEQITSSFCAEEVGFILVTENFENKKVMRGSTPFFFTEKGKIYIDYISNKIKKERDSLFIGDFEFSDGSYQSGYKSIMAVPMVQTGVIKGFSLVMHQKPYYFSFETFKLLQSLIHHSTLAFTNSMLREELERMVITDHLTGLYSRNYLDARVHKSMDEDKQGTFILIDIDNFKQINDTFGHQVGDEVLVQVATIIHHNIRDTDVGARWGGEELAIYLPKIPLETGIVIAKRLVEKVSHESTPNITISCGVSYWIQGQDDNFTNLFKRADQALYIAKETGKNKVVIQEDVEYAN